MIQPKFSLWKSIKESIGHVAFQIFLWAYEMTNDEYLSMIYEDAAREYQSEKANGWRLS